MPSCKTTRRIEFDLGHRVPNHKSKCYNVHGHRYVLLVTAFAPLIDESGNSSEGMVIDFGDLKKIIGGYVDRFLDHGYVGHKEYDKDLLTMLRSQNMKCGASNFPPTAENLALWMLRKFNELIHDPERPYLHIEKITLYETPNGVVDVDRTDLQGSENYDIEFFESTR